MYKYVSLVIFESMNYILYRYSYILTSYYTFLNNTYCVYSFPVLLRRCFEILLLQVISTQRGIWQCFPFRLASPPTKMTKYDKNPLLDFILLRLFIHVILPCTFLPFPYSLIHPPSLQQTTELCAPSIPGGKNDTLGLSFAALVHFPHQ